MNVSRSGCDGDLHGHAEKSEGRWHMNVWARRRSHRRARGPYCGQCMGYGALRQGWDAPEEEAACLSGTRELRLGYGVKRAPNRLGRLLISQAGKILDRDE